MPYVFEVEGLGRLPAGKVVGIGKNYEDHVKEMQGTLWSSGKPVDLERRPEPVVFLKPATSLLADGGRVLLPQGVGEVHHELELAALVGTTARRVPRARALEHVAGYGVALDMTARDVQAAAKKAGLPWTFAKGLDTFCPVSRIVPARDVPDPQDVALELKVNGETRQKGSTRHMIHPVADLVAFVSSRITLEPGDLILTGTPAGVGPVRAGDRLEASASGVATLRVEVADDAAES